MTERDKKLKDELKRFSNLLEQTKESARTLLAILAEEPPIIPITYIHAIRPRLNTLLSRDELDAVQKELNKIRELYKQDD
jgi:hypothetical protein